MPNWSRARRESSSSSEIITHSLDDYEQVIGGKTASADTHLGPARRHRRRCRQPAVDALTTWAWELGHGVPDGRRRARPRRDEETIGKPAGSDIREGTFTGPVLRAVSGPEGEKVTKLLATGRPYDDATVDEVIALVRDGGHIDAALESAKTRVTIAELALATLPASKPRAILESLGAYLLERVEAARG